MVVGAGVDIAEVARMERALSGPTGPRVRDRLFTASEQSYCEARGRGRVESYAARFAAKEATLKVLGTGPGSAAGWREIEVLRDAAGRPRLMLHGAAARTARVKGVERLALSLSHAGGMAVAFVVGEGRDPAPQSAETMGAGRSESTAGVALDVDEGEKA
jgi:holo-[acyl-carrier protein] synthase